MSAEEAVTTGQAWKDFCRALEAAGDVVLKGPDSVLDRAEGMGVCEVLEKHQLRDLPTVLEECVRAR